MRLDKKVVLVTGAAKGIGRAIALKLAAQGAYVIVNYRGSEDKAKETLEFIKSLNGDGEIYKCDVSKYEDVKQMMDYVLEKHSKLDILVNNAGITKDNLLMKMSEEEFDNVIESNLKSAFNCMQLVSRAMIKARSGRIVNISSVSGVMGNAGQVNYAAAKAGMIGMTKSAARELASRGITVNAIAPGFIETDMTAVLPDSIKEAVVQSIPMKAFGKAEDIANAVCFLSSEEARYISGQVLCVDGGLHM